MRENPSSRAIALRSIVNEFPASAPEPIGHASALAAACCNRVMSRVNASACASRKCESRIGWACCMCVMPAIGKPRFSFACRRNELSSAERAFWTRAAAAGMQFPAERSEFFDESFFDEVVHIFGISSEAFQPCNVRFRALGNFVERSKSLLHFSGGENADRFERSCPRTIDRNLVRQEPTIKRKRALERVELSIWLTFEASAPQPVVFPFGHWSVLGRITFCYLRPLPSGARLRATQTN